MPRRRRTALAYPRFSDIRRRGTPPRVCVLTAYKRAGRQLLRLLLLPLPAMVVVEWCANVGLLVAIAVQWRGVHVQ